MKAQNSKPKITYSEDVDILMIQLSNQKVDDSYDTDNMIIQVDKNGLPVILEIFNGKKFAEDFNKALPKKLKEKTTYQNPTPVSHRIK